MSEVTEYKIENPIICDKCGKPTGKSSLTYAGMEVWIGCDCMPKDRVYIVDPNQMEEKGLIKNLGEDPK